MKLSLLVLAVLCGVALSSPVAKNNVDGLLDDLLKILKRDEGASGAGQQGPAGSGAGPRPGSGAGPRDDSDEDEDEKTKDAVKGKKKDLRKAKMFAEFCGADMSQKIFMTPVSLEDVGKVYMKLHELVNALANKFDEHKDLLSTLEEEEEESEETENTKALLEKFSKIPDQDVVKKVMCGIGALKVLLMRAKVTGLNKNDFPDVENCHATCGQLVGLLPDLRKGETPAIDVATLKGNVKADYTCIKSHVQGLKAAFDHGKKEYEETKKVDANGSLIGLMLLDHAFEALMVRGHQLHTCSAALFSMAGRPAPEPAPKEPQEQSRQLRGLLAALNKMS